MKKVPKIWWVFPALVLTAVLILTFRNSGRQDEQADSQSPGESGPAITFSETGKDEVSGDALKVDEPDSVNRGLHGDMLLKLFRLTERFQLAGNEGEKYAIYRELLALIQASEEDVAASAIVDYLRSGKDASTGFEFEVGPDGALVSAPTVRTMLLDQIGQLDPHLALEVSREVMDGRTNPDEYALGIRNLAWFDLEGDTHPEMEKRFSEMLDETSWLAGPSTGFLEAFDIAVELASLKSFENIVSVIKLEDENGAPVLEGVEKAAFVAMDRIMLRNPDAVIETFLKDPSLLDFAPDHRASLLSRLDITQASEREAFVTYLNRGGHGEGELEYFGSIFPNGNYFYGNRLVSSQEETPSITTIQKRDAETLQIVKAMIQNGEVTGTAIEKIQNQLERFVSEVNNVTEPVTDLQVK